MMISPLNGDTIIMITPNQLSYINNEHVNYLECVEQTNTLTARLNNMTSNNALLKEILKAHQTDKDLLQAKYDIKTQEFLLAQDQISKLRKTKQILKTILTITIPVVIVETLLLL